MIAWTEWFTRPRCTLPPKTQNQKEQEEQDRKFDRDEGVLGYGLICLTTETERWLCQHPEFLKQLETRWSSRIGFGSNDDLVQVLKEILREKIAPELQLEEMIVGTSASVIMLEFVPVLFALQGTKDVKYPTYIRMKKDWGTYLGSEHPGGMALPNVFTQGVGSEIWVDLDKQNWQTVLTRTVKELPTNTKILGAVIEPFAWKTLKPRSETELSKLLKFCRRNKIPIILDVSLSAFCTGPGYLGIPSNSCLSEAHFLIASKNVGSAFACSTLKGREMFPTYDKVTKKHQKTLTVQKDSIVLASIILILLYHVHTEFESRVEIINQAVPKLLKQYGFEVPTAGGGFLWKYSRIQTEQMKGRGDFVKTVLDESKRLRFHPDMDVKQIEDRIKHWNEQYPIKKSGKTNSKSRDDCVSSDDDTIQQLTPITEILSPGDRIKCHDFDIHWNKCLGGVQVVSGDTAYGELNSATAARIWNSVHTLIGIKSTDTVLDIGAGTGKFVHSKEFLCPTAGVKLMGMENAPAIYKRSQEILKRFPLENADLQFGDSAKVKDWGTVTIAYGYEGSPGTDLNIEHKTIMLALLKTPSLRAIASTKMKKGVFLDYTVDDKAIRKKWVLVRIPEQKFGKSSHQVGSCYHCCLNIVHDVIVNVCVCVVLCLCDSCCVNSAIVIVRVVHYISYQSFVRFC